MIDLLVADATAWTIIHGLWIAATATAGAACLAAYLTARRIRTLGRDNRRLAADAAEAKAAAAAARLVAAIERANAEAGFRHAAKAQRRLEAVIDGVTCAEMELHWEEGPR